MILDFLFPIFLLYEKIFKSYTPIRKCDFMSEKLGESKVTSRFQVTLPQKAREILELKKGDYVIFYYDKKAKLVYLRAAKLVEK